MMVVVIVDVLLPGLLDLVEPAVCFVGRRLQAVRARRLLRRSRLRCALLDADRHLLHRTHVDGVAQISLRRLVLGEVDLRIAHVEGTPVAGPERARDEDGTLVFGPRTIVHRLRLENGRAVSLVVLAIQGEAALEALGLTRIR